MDRTTAPELTLRTPRNRPDRRALRWWLTRAAIIALPVPLTLGILWLTIPPARGVFSWLTLATAVPALAWISVEPVWRYRVHRWEVTDAAVHVVTGWVWQFWQVVPLSRVQSVDTVRGPLQQLFGLSGITLTTAAASGTVHLAGLDRRTAAALVERLATAIEVGAP